MFSVKTHWVKNKKECFEFLDKNQTKMILLDINIGEESGFEICKKLRETTDIPILFISSRKSDDDVLLALNIGGDDYIEKPYSLSILLAKVKAVLKRANGVSQKSEVFGDVKIDSASQRIIKDNEVIKLKTMEYKLLEYLISHKNQVITKEELFSNVWGDIIIGDGTLNVHIRWLREKIEKDPNNPKFIKTVWGTGYIFEVE